jgi:hypothetical protein
VVSRSWFKASSSPGSFSDGCGWKMFAKCSAKACSSTSLFAKIPCDVVSGGEGFLTCFIFLVAFHRE